MQVVLHGNGFQLFIIFLIILDILIVLFELMLDVGALGKDICTMGGTGVFGQPFTLLAGHKIMHGAASYTYVGLFAAISNPS